MLWYRLTMPGRELVHGGDQGQPDGGHDQRVLHQVLSLFIANKSDDCELSLFLSCYRAEAVLAGSVRESSNGPTNSLLKPDSSAATAVPAGSASNVAGLPSRRATNSRFLRAAECALL